MSLGLCPHTDSKFTHICLHLYTHTHTHTPSDNPGAVYTGGLVHQHTQLSFTEGLMCQGCVPVKGCKQQSPPRPPSRQDWQGSSCVTYWEEAVLIKWLF